MSQITVFEVSIDTVERRRTSSLYNVNRRRSTLFSDTKIDDLCFNR